MEAIRKEVSRLCEQASKDIDTAKKLSEVAKYHAITRYSKATNAVPAKLYIKNQNLRSKPLFFLVPGQETNF